MAKLKSIGIVFLLTCLVAAVHAGRYELIPAPLKNPSGGAYSWTSGSQTNAGLYGGTVSYGDAAGGTNTSGGASALCEGEITSIYRWVKDKLLDANGQPTVHDDPDDLPPQNVILKEDSTAWMFAWNTSAPVRPPGTANNGLGHATVAELDQIVYTTIPVFPPIQIPIGYKLKLVSQGVRYQLIPGGETISVNAEPQASTSTSVGPAEAHVIYKSEIIVPKITLTGRTLVNDGSGFKYKFLAGQHVKAAVTCGDLSFETNGIQWNLPENAFREYLQVNANPLQIHTPAQLKASLVAFALPAKNESGIVECEAKITCPPGATCSSNPMVVDIRSSALNCVKPTGSYKITTGQVRYFDATLDRFGLYSGGIVAHGQLWNAIAFSFPIGFLESGKACFIQKVVPKRRYVYSQPTRVFRLLEYGKECLDSSFPYPYATSNGEWDLPNSVAFGVDNPWQPRLFSVPPPWERTEADDSFETFLMFKPVAVPGFNSYYVPIATHTWAWRAYSEAPLSSELTNVIRPNNGESGLHEEMPTWTRKIVSNQLVFVQEGSK